MRIRKRVRAIPAHEPSLRLGAGMVLSNQKPDITTPALIGTDWNYDSLGGLRWTPPAGWMRGEDAPQQLPQSRVPETIRPWQVKPIVGNHWVSTYYRTPPDNLVTDASAHTGSPHISITNGHYAKFMPPPVSLGYQRASRGQIPYTVPTTQDAGMPYYHDYKEQVYTAWTG